MSTSSRSPSQLRSMLGENLRKLATEHSSVSALSRELRINRTQFNRYLSGESFPRPDVLARICTFFGTDPRILLEPIEHLHGTDSSLAGPHIKDFMGNHVISVDEDTLPSGFYRFSRQSFVDMHRCVRGLVYVYRVDDSTFVKGFEPKEAMAMQGIPPDRNAREFRGLVMQLDGGVAFTVCRRKGLTASFNFLNRVTSFENNFWVGYVARTVAENPASTRMTRLVYEFMGPGSGAALNEGRAAGFCNFDDLLPFHQRLLQPGSAFR